MISEEILKTWNKLIIDEIIKEPIGGAHRNSEETILNTKEALLENLKEFEKSTREEVFNQRKEKFLNIGKHKTFTIFSKDNEWIKKETFIQNITRSLL